MKKIVSVLIFLLFIVAAGGLIGAMNYHAHLPQYVHQHETIVLGQNRLVPGSQAALRVVVRDSRDAAPLPDAKIDVFLSDPSGNAPLLFSGQTDASGSANVSFTVPADASGERQLIVKTESKLGNDTVEQKVTLVRDYSLLITTDKPLYQPGQIIHLRTLALSPFDLQPAADQPLEVVIADGKGNKVFRKTLTTSPFGVASTDFQLAGQVNSGAYQISVIMGSTQSEKTVTVEHYVLPKFKINLNTEQTYYRPGEHVSASLNAAYFFGKPVSDGQVSIEGYTYDVEQTTFFTLQGVTDAEGNLAFEFDLPSYLAGSDLEGGLGRVSLQVVLTDQANHSETAGLSIPVAQQPLVIEAIPEGGQFRPGVENIYYVLVSYPDGAPAETTLTVTTDDGKQITADTNAYGLAEIHLTPPYAYRSMSIYAEDRRGNTASQTFPYTSTLLEETVLLRPAKPIYQVGETLTLTLLTSAPQGTVYFDIIRGGQTVSTRAVDVADGRAMITVDLSPEMAGTLELHAYKILRSGVIVRDTRLVLVDQAQALNVALTPGADTYRPGDTAQLDVQVTGEDGQGMPAALGLAVVDEAVFALAEQDPGFARLYFLLEAELLQPKYDLHGFSVPDLVAPDDRLTGDPALYASVQDAAQASLAATLPQNYTPGLQVNTHEKGLAAIQQRQWAFFNPLSKNLLNLLWLLALVIVLSTVGLLAVRGVLREALGLALASIVCVGCLMVNFYPLGLLGLGLAVLGFCIGLIALLVDAIRHHDRLQAGLLRLGGLCILIVAAFAYAANRSHGIYTWQAIWPLLFIVGSFLVLIMGMFFRRKDSSAIKGMSATLLILLLVGCSTPAPTQEFGMFPPDAIMLAEPTQAPAATETPALETADTSTGETAAPRLRQYFPETMLWLPDAVTDENGMLHLEFPVADSITTWRMTALASTLDGRLGSAVAGLRVFQDFFIDLDLPLALTVDDEISLPVGVFNYLPDAQTVRLELTEAAWFEALDEPIKQITIQSNDIGVVYFRVRVLQPGTGQPFAVTAYGTQMSDAIQKTVRVLPNGKSFDFTFSGSVQSGDTLDQVVDFPAAAIPGTQNLLVKIYPGVASQIVEGLDSILRMPNGCFEQTSSSTYPNLMVLDYLKTTGQVSPEVQMRAEEYINIGYQRLTTFEVPGGGFSLFGQAPADRMLTAYGLQEFADMSRVHDVDPALSQRAAEWLFTQQESDGSWANDRGLVHESTWANLGNDRLPVTAYIVWSLAEAGLGNDSRTQRGVNYLLAHQAEAEDPYVVALLANALVAANAEPADTLNRLAALALRDGDLAFWSSGVATFMGSQGQTGSIETTALATLALLRGMQFAPHAETAQAALAYLVQSKDSNGTWHTTQATILALKVLLESARNRTEQVDASLTIRLNGGQVRTLRISPENFDVVQLVALNDLNPGENQVAIAMEGEGNVMYQITGAYYLPWENVAADPTLRSADSGVQIDVAYERTQLAVDDTVSVSVTVRLQQGHADSALIDLGLPPGFTVLAEDLDALLAASRDVPADYTGPTLERYELTGRQIILYISNLGSDAPMQLHYRLQAKFPLVAQTPASHAYDYYNPNVNGEAVPQVLVVEP